MPSLKIDLNSDTYAALTDIAVAKRRSVPRQAQVMIERLVKQRVKKTAQRAPSVYTAQEDTDEDPWPTVKQVEAR